MLCRRSTSALLIPTAHAPMRAAVEFRLPARVASNWLAEADYVGTKSTHLDVIYDYNQPIIAGGVSTKVQPYSNFGANRIHDTDRLWQLQRVAGKPDSPTGEGT